METITDFEEFLANEGPESADERADLAACAEAPNSLGRYSSELGRGGGLVIRGADMALFLTDKARKAFLRRLREGLSEPGATFAGDAAFERGMAKDD